MSITTEPTDQLAHVIAALDGLVDVRYEVIDGSVVVSPPPGYAHESRLARLQNRLANAAPRGVEVLGSNYGFLYGDEGHFLLPDLTVVRSADTEDRGTRSPLLVVEVRSSSTWRRDEGDKRDIYAEGGVPSYWLLDPVAPALRVLELRGSAYAEVACLDGPGTLQVRHPFPVEIALD